VGSEAGNDAVSAREPRPTALIDAASANMERMLGYVFWHWPSPGCDRRAYEEELAAFHKTLADEPPGGFLRSGAFRPSRLPFAGAGSPEVVYEDWYVVEGWHALGELNAAAVSGSREPAHARVAARSAGGAGAVYALVRGLGALEHATCAAWFAEPREPPQGADVWQRQMVLGPAPEFCIVCARGVDLPYYDRENVVERALVTIS